jgi:5-methylcytosine-specific restriction enzyme A
LRDHLRALAEEFGRHLVVKGSAGQGTWAKGPWLGIFNPIVTTGAQSGYYVCFLFREDMQGVYLSLNQGMTEAKSLYKSDAKTALSARAQNFRALLGSHHLSAFDSSAIDLAPSAPSNDTAFYEAGNICSKFYQAGAMPNDAALRSDLRDMLALYEALIEAEAGADPSLAEEGEGVSTMVEDGTRLRIHKRIERNGKLVQQVKKQKGTRCEVCGTDFGERCGEMGAGYIEAHHLRPLASLKGTKVHLDPAADFAVLCANCHRMVHRSGLIDDIERFKSEHFHG